MGKYASVGISKRRKATQTVKKANGEKTCANRTLWVPSADKPPSDNAARRKAVQDALKKGSVVLHVDGQFFRVPTRHRLSLKNTLPRYRARKTLERYKRYMKGQTLGEILRSGALLADVSCDFKHGLLKFVPTFKGTRIEEPLPKSQWPPGIRVKDGHAPWWLPMNWAHGVKTTCRSYLPVFIAPDGATYYHQQVVQAIVKEDLRTNTERIVAAAQSRISEMKDWHGDPVQFDPDKRLFACLTKEERNYLPRVAELYFCVISARRATELSGIQGIVNVQSQLLASGINACWYVDRESLKDYRRLGINATVGGQLTPSRNKALRDASRLNKACVQISDDVSGWEFYTCGLDVAALRARGAKMMLKAANKAKDSRRIVISPSAAARFLLAKMRAAAGRPRLGGVLPTGNATLALLAQMTTLDGFILGDFFVHDDSPCRFDETMTLKEDYDFTCTHLARHGCVMRCNHIVLKVAHETNAGGAVALRDPKGNKERQNIRVLMRKWPGVFKLHSTRGDTQVKMKWSHRR